MTHAEMSDAIEGNARILAAPAFQAIDAERLEQTLEYRVENPEHRLCKLLDGHYNPIKGALRSWTTRGKSAA